MFNKGAMFGLDARIALAIFGALSVISGAALYSAIQQAKVTSLVTTLNEMEKAYESYLLDTGTHMPLDSTDVNNSTIEMDELFSSSVNDWKGPYISIPRSTNADWTEGLLDLPNYGFTNFLIAPNKNWTSSNNCTSDTTVDCFSWIIVRDVPLTTAKELDLLFDGSATVDSGKIRHKTVGSNEHLFVRMLKVK